MTHVYNINDEILWEWGLKKEVPIFKTQKKLEKDKQYKVFVAPNAGLNSSIFHNDNIKKTLKPENADIIVMPETLNYQEHWFSELRSVCQNTQTDRIYIKNLPTKGNFKDLSQRDFVKYNKDSIKLLQILPSLDKTKFVTTVDFKNFFSSKVGIDEIIQMINSEDEDTVNLGISLLGNVSLKNNYLKILSLFCPIHFYDSTPKLLLYKNKTIMQNTLQELKNVFPTFNANTSLIIVLKDIIRQKDYQKFTTTEYEEIQKILAEHIVEELNRTYSEFLYALNVYGKEVEVIVDLSFCDSKIIPYKTIWLPNEFTEKVKISLLNLSGKEGVIIGMLHGNFNDYIDDIIINTLPKSNYYTFRVNTTSRKKPAINKNSFVNVLNSHDNL